MPGEAQDIENGSDMDTTSSSADGRCSVTVRPDSFSAALARSATAPAYYLGRPAHVWMAAFRPRPRHGDSAPGQARGNNLNLNGGLWHEVVISP